MDQRKLNLRRQAAQAFMASLDELQDILKSDTQQTVVPTNAAEGDSAPKHSAASVPQSETNEAELFEQAAADLEALSVKDEG